MKHFKQIIIYLSILSIFTVFLFSTNPLRVYAEIPASQKAIAHNSTWGNYPFNYYLQKKYFTIEDPTGIPNDNNKRYFYTPDNVKFYDVKADGLLTDSLLRIGIVLAEGVLQAYLVGYFTIADQLGSDNHIQGGLYDGNGNFIGYCLNDISGCYYQSVQDPADQPAIPVPTYQTDNVKNAYDYLNADDYPDYITVVPPSVDWTLSKGYIGPFSSSYTEAKNEAYNTWATENLTTLLNSYDNLGNFSLLSKGVSSPANGQFFKCFIDNYYLFNNVHYIQNSSGSYWNNFCSKYELTKDNPEFLASELYFSIPDVPTNSYITYNPYDNTTNNLLTTVDRLIVSYNSSTHEFNSTLEPATTQSGFYSYLGRYGTTRLQYQEDGVITTGDRERYNIYLGKQYTVYKNADIYTSVNVTKDYSPNSFVTNNYTNYDDHSDHSYNTTIENTDNSNTNMGDIYDDCDDSFNDYVNNGTIHQGDINNNTQTIINNYYPDNEDDNGGGDNGGGSGSDEDINDNGVLKAILDAIKHFFSIIGQLLGTILAGILEVINNILESIAGVMDNMTGVIDFISALFSWIPSPVPEVLALGISITILFAIIRFIRG